MLNKLKKEWATILSCLAIGIGMTLLYYWIFTDPVQQSNPPPEPSPEPHVVVLDTFSPTVLKQEINRRNILFSNIVYNQARLETGNFMSPVFKSNKNLFGFVGRNGYIKYNTWQESVKDYKRWQLKYYKSGDYYAFLEKIGYAKDTLYTYKLRNF